MPFFEPMIEPPSKRMPKMSLTDLQKIALLFNGTPDANSAADRHLDTSNETEKCLYNFASFFADDQECWDKFINLVKTLKN